MSGNVQSFSRVASFQLNTNGTNQSAHSAYDHVQYQVDQNGTKVGRHSSISCRTTEEDEACTCPEDFSKRPECKCVIEPRDCYGPHPCQCCTSVHCDLIGHMIQGQTGKMPPVPTRPTFQLNLPNLNFPALDKEFQEDIKDNVTALFNEDLDKIHSDFMSMGNPLENFTFQALAPNLPSFLNFSANVLKNDWEKFHSKMSSIGSTLGNFTFPLAPNFTNFLNFSNFFESHE